MDTEHELDDLSAFVIDDKEKGEELWVEVSQREHARLNAFIDKHIKYTDNPSFLDRLDRWLDLRGVWPRTSSGTDDSSKICATLFVAHLGQIDAKNISMDRDNSLVEFVQHLGSLHVERWIEVETSYNHPDLVEDLRELFVAEHAADKRLGFRRLEIIQMYEKVVNWLNPYFTTGINHPPVIWDNKLPRHQLTDLQAHGINDQEVWRKGVCTIEALIETFELPRIPENGIWAYCIKGGRVAQQVLEKLVGAEGRVEIDPVLRAAALEKIWIF